MGTAVASIKDKLQGLVGGHKGPVSVATAVDVVDERSVHVKDVTKPGDPGTRPKEMRAVAELGAAPLIWTPTLNRGTNFSDQERMAKRLEGLLPPAKESLELQAERVLLQLHEECPHPLDKYEAISVLAGTNTTLLYYVLMNHLTELAPIVYTPTVGEACQKFDRIYRQPLGMYFDGFAQRGRFRKMLDNWPSYNVQIIVVTDGSRILGLGDLGTNGMGISIGKIQLYVGGGGFHPEHSLPACLDCGTNTKEYLEDKFYLGNKKARLEGEEHMAVVEEFCMAVKDKWPNCLVQFEDFETSKAFTILERMRDRMLCFNDDIQGTGAVVTTGFINGMKAQGTNLKDARVVFYGAGSSAVGVATMIARLLQKEAGLSHEQAMKAIYMVDSKGLVTTTRGDKLAPHKQAVARTDGTPDMKGLKDVIAHVKPQTLIGLTGAGPAFTQDIVEELCSHCEHPLIFPLSNPTSKSEITAKDAYEFSKGKCIFASGSPFDPYKYQGKVLEPGQANNVFIFPGVGFGAVMAKASTVKDEMFLAAARALADSVTKAQFDKGAIYPELKDLRKISAQVATAVAEEALALGVAGIERPPEGLMAFIEARMWDPSKAPLSPMPQS